jgi:hypothetical protein
VIETQKEPDLVFDCRSPHLFRRKTELVDVIFAVSKTSDNTHSNKKESNIEKEKLFTF